MILIDTSAWVDFLRGTGSPVCNRVEDLLDGEIAICDAIRMEMLAGARNEQHLQSLRRLLARAVTLPTRPSDYEDAALLYRSCRRGGETVRKLIDCLIAAVALRNDTPILHADRDFNTIARHSPLEVVEHLRSDIS